MWSAEEFHNGAEYSSPPFDVINNFSTVCVFIHIYLSLVPVSLHHLHLSDSTDYLSPDS
jgi:hypothetical protein